MHLHQFFSEIATNSLPIVVRVAKPEFWTFNAISNKKPFHHVFDSMELSLYQNEYNRLLCS